VTLNGLTKIDNTDGQISYFYLLQENVRGTEQTIQIIFEDTDGNIQVIEGTVLIPDITFNSSVGSFSDVNVTFEGSGRFTIEQSLSGAQSGSGLCETILSDTWIMAAETNSISGAGNEGRSFAGMDILEVDREGTQFDYTSGSPGNREFSFDGTNIIFQDDVPAGQTETVFVLWKVT
jgi:hypothetical protein